MGDTIAPIVIMGYISSCFMKPKREDSFYKRFLYFHFATFTILSEVGSAIGHIRAEKVMAWFAIFRIPFWFLLFWQGAEKLRKAISVLPSSELSEFLCSSVILKSTAAMGPMIFFSFESVSCFTGHGTLANGICANTSRASLSISMFIVALTSLSIVNKSLPKPLQKKVVWEYTKVATLELKWFQKIQGALILFTAVATLYLLGYLGVSGRSNSSVDIVGGVGCMSVGLAVLIGVLYASKLNANMEEVGVRGGGR